VTSWAQKRLGAWLLYFGVFLVALGVVFLKGDEPWWWALGALCVGAFLLSVSRDV
jgi:amino acid transporter